MCPLVRGIDRLNGSLTFLSQRLLTKLNTCMMHLVLSAVGGQEAGSPPTIHSYYYNNVRTVFSCREGSGELQSVTAAMLSQHTVPVSHCQPLQIPSLEKRTSTCFASLAPLMKYCIKLVKPTVFMISKWSQWCFFCCHAAMQH